MATGSISRTRYERDILIAAKLGMGLGIDGAVRGLECGVNPAQRLNQWIKKRVPGFGNLSPREKNKGYWRDADAEVPAPVDLSTPEARVWSYIANSPSPHTRKAYAADLRKCADLLGLDGMADLLSIETAHGMRLLELLRAKGHAEGTVLRTFRVVRHLLERECRLGYRERPNPLDKLLIREPRGEPRSTLDVLSVDEVRAVLKLCDAGRHQRDRRDSALLRVAFWCGLRVGELAGMTAARPGDWSHVREGAHFAREGGKLILHVVGKGEKARSMPVAKVIEQKLGMYLKVTGRDWDDTSPLWRPTRGRKAEGMDPRSIRRLVQARCRQAGIDKKISTHSTRKTAATRLVTMGVNIEDVRRFMGHTSIITTQRYFGTNGEDHPAAKMRY